VETISPPIEVDILEPTLIESTTSSLPSTEESDAVSSEAIELMLSTATTSNVEDIQNRIEDIAKSIVEAVTTTLEDLDEPAIDPALMEDENYWPSARVTQTARSKPPKKLKKRIVTI